MAEYLIDVRFKTNVKRTDRVLEIAEAFGLGLNDKEFVVFDNLKLNVVQGDIVYITGQSGSGKSVLLRELSKQMEAAGMDVANIDKIEFTDEPVINQIGKDNMDGQGLLSLAGISDANLYLVKPSELSDGQRYRMRLAKLIESGAKVWIADEFLAVLDRVTAKNLAYNLQRTARKFGVTLMVATTHMDMVDDLDPDLYIDKRYREKITVRVKDK